MIAGETSQNNRDLGLTLLNKYQNDYNTTIDCLVTDAPAKKTSIIFKNIYKWRGFFYALISAFIISLTNILINKCKSFSGSEMVVLRFVLQIAIMLPIAIYKKINIFGVKGQRFMLSIRGIFGTIGLLSIYFAITLINPSDAVALFNCGVIFVNIFARIFLKEKLTIVHLLALILTVLGIIFISQPSFLLNQDKFSNDSQTGAYFATPSTFSINSTTSYTALTQANNFTYRRILGFGLSLTGALSYATVSIILKKLANKKVHLSVVLLYATYYGMPVSILLSAFLLVTGVDNRKRTILNSSFDDLKYEIAYAILSALLSVSQQILMNMAVNIEDASKVSILKSTDLLFIFLFQYLLLGIHSNFNSILGAVLIFCGALFVMIYKIIDKRHTKKMDLLSKNDGLLTEQNEYSPPMKNTSLAKLFSRIFYYKF